MTRYAIILLALLSSCEHKPTPTSSNASKTTWQVRFDKELPLLGHRNWILVVDAAYPAQTAEGMEVINTNDNLGPVLQYVMSSLEASNHVRPTVYRDREWSFITEDKAKGAQALHTQTDGLLKERQVQTILHDSVFAKLDQASHLFKILVLKTNTAVPYSSVFLQLNCAYWNAQQEASLREEMKAGGEGK
jgi:L-fucose mutarotase/ribose pyranase (RbsD/FucU family)